MNTVEHNLTFKLELYLHGLVELHLSLNDGVIDISQVVNELLIYFNENCINSIRLKLFDSQYSKSTIKKYKKLIKYF